MSDDKADQIISAIDRLTIAVRFNVGMGLTLAIMIAALVICINIHALHM